MHVLNIEDIYVQFIAKGQCTDFLDDFLNCKFITTESNTQSMLAMQQNSKSAAVIPNHLLTDQNYNLVKQNITDYHNNQTRFLVFSDTTDECYAGKSADYKTSIIVLFHSDYPGYLENILSKFTQCNINLISIVSRPTRQEFGKYHFFIDLDGHQKDTNIDMALTDIQQYFNVKILGSYLKH
jgi:prephenate dehydratase